MLAEGEKPMKLLLAGIAATHGSEKAAVFLGERFRDPDYQNLMNAYPAITMLLFYYHGELPDWAVEMLMMAICDDREMTGLETTRWHGNTHFTASRLADSLGGFRPSSGSSNAARRSLS